MKRRRRKAPQKPPPYDLCASVVRHPHHCRVCGHCVSGFDHHCGVLGRCITDRNIGYFYVLVAMGYAGLLTTMALTIVVAFALGEAADA